MTHSKRNRKNNKSKVPEYGYGVRREDQSELLTKVHYSIQLFILTRE